MFARLQSSQSDGLPMPCSLIKRTEIILTFQDSKRPGQSKSHKNATSSSSTSRHSRLQPVLVVQSGMEGSRENRGWSLAVLGLARKEQELVVVMVISGRTCYARTSSSGSGSNNI